MERNEIGDLQLVVPNSASGQAKLTIQLIAPVSPCRIIRRHSTKVRLGGHSTKVRLGLAKLLTLGIGKPIIVQVAFAPRAGDVICLMESMDG